MTLRLKQKHWLLLAAAAILIAAGLWVMPGKKQASESVPTFMVQKGPLEINVLQGGELRALRNFEVRSEIAYTTKIISLIPEGYFITEEDIREGKVLVEMDDSELKEKIQDHDIDFQSTVSIYIDADENREIQRSENQSNLRAKRELALFSLMDFEKYLGSSVATAILETAQLPQDAEKFDKFAAELEARAVLDSNATLATAKDLESTSDAPQKTTKRQASKSMLDSDAVDRIDFTAFLENKGNSDGEALQTLRQLEDKLLLSKSELAVATQKVESSERLAEQDFITRAQLENDQVNFEKVQLSVKSATTELELFRRYEFTKQCTKLLSAYRESLNELQRTVRENRSRLAQVETKFQSAKRRYEMELAKKEDLQRQLKACVIKAEHEGLVAYGDISVSSYYSRDPIEEGASVRFKQTILTIPDMSQMGVYVKVHESQVKKVRVGQPALVTVDAEPGKILEGSVSELAVLPDSSASRYTPNLKVYPSTINISGTHAWLKPGMNAQVTIIINQLADVMFVPVQSVEVAEDVHFCYVNTSSGLERREISTGLFNDQFIEIREGLEPGEAVALSLPKPGSTDSTRQLPPEVDGSQAKPKGKQLAIR